MQSPTRRTARLAPLTLASLLVLAQLGVLLAIAPTASALTFDSISPTSGTANGGQTVTITGTGFDTSGTLPRVTFDNVPAAAVVVDSSTQITAKAPPHAAGTVLVVVTNPAGDNAGRTFTYNAATPPSITSLSTNVGSSNGGAAITITGSAFATDSDYRPLVTIGGARAAVTANTAISLTVTIPPHAAGSNLELKVTNPDGQSDTTTFSYATAPTPTIGVLADTGGPSNGGETITFATTNAATGASVTLGGVLAEVVTLSATSVTIKTPAHAAGTVDLILTNPDGQAATKAGAYTYTADNPPTITNIKVNDPVRTRLTLNPLGGTEIRITGTGFYTGTNAEPTVAVGGNPIHPDFVTVDSATQITALAPQHATGAATVTVQNPDGRLATSGASFTYTDPMQLKSINPTSGTSNGGTTLTLTGVGFQSGAKVIFGTALATSVTVTSSGSGTSLTVVTPANPLNTAISASITVVNPDGTQAMLSPGFLYTVVAAGSAPTVTTLSASSGTTNGGTSLTITGTNFHTGSNAKPVVMVGSLTVPADKTTVTSATSITVITPARTAGSASDQQVKVTNPNGQASANTAADDFDYTGFDPVTVTLVSPTTTTSNGGATITLTGTSFHTGTNQKPTVTVNGVLSPSVTVTSSTSLTFIAPPQTTAGSKVIVVTNPNTQANTPNAVDDVNDDLDYTMSAAPDVTSISPTSGSSVGGYSATLAGTGFSTNTLNKATVKFGSIDAVVGTVTALSAPVTVPSHPVQSGVTVTFTNPDGQSDTVTFAFTAGSAPTITSLSVSTAATTAGDMDMVLTIAGTNFGSGALVTIGGNSAPVCKGLDLSASDAVVKGCAARSGTSLTVEIPNGIANSQANIIVQNPDGQLATNNAFRYLLAPPILSGSSGTGGTSGGDGVAFTGTNIAMTTTPRQQAATDGIAAIVTGGLTANVLQRNTAGSVITQVFDVDGQSATRTNGFTYVTDPAPLITKIAPNGGPSRGGTMVTISGYYLSNFYPVIKVGGVTATQCTAAGVPYTGCTAPSDTSVAAFTGSHAAGLVDLTFAHLDTQTVTSTGAFQYLGTGGAAAPDVTGISPIEGSTSGGTAVTITGTGFSSAAVKFGANAATEVITVSATQITAKTPAGNAGKVDVVVTNGDGQADTLTQGFEYKTSLSTTTTTTSGTTTTSSTVTTTSSTVTTTGTTTNGGSTPTAAEIQQANEDVDVDVEREGDDNIVKFDLPALADLPANPAGVQLWRSTSPFVLVKTIDDDDAAFDAGEYRDEGAPEGAKYLVTIYYGLTNALGFSSCTPLADCTGSALPPGFAALGDGTGIGDGNKGMPTWAWILIGVLVVAIIVVIVVVATRRKPAEREPAEGYAWNTAAETTTAASMTPPPAAPVAGQVHNTRCPTCKTEFTVTGAKPISTTCPNCGQRGTLR